MAGDETQTPCREEKCLKVALHAEHPWDFYKMPAGEWVPCPSCRGEDGAGACAHCGDVRTVPRRRGLEILAELRGGISK